jgi:Sec-independent protein translocase protein TatA
MDQIVYYHSRYCPELFGVKKIPEIARSFGISFIRVSRRRIEAERELKRIKKEETDPNLKS